MYYTLVKKNENLQQAHIDFYVNAAGDILVENISLSEKAQIQRALIKFYTITSDILTYIIKYQNKLYLALLCEHDNCTKEYFKCSNMHELYIRYTLPAAKLLRTATLFFKDTIILCGVTSGFEMCNEIFTLVPLDINIDTYNKIISIMNEVCYYLKDKKKCTDIKSKPKDSSYLLDVGITLSEKEYEEFRSITSNNSDKMKTFLIKQILDDKADLLEVNKI